MFEYKLKISLCGDESINFKFLKKQFLIVFKCKYFPLSKLKIHQKESTFNNSTYNFTVNSTTQKREK